MRKLLKARVRNLSAAVLCTALLLSGCGGGGGDAGEGAETPATDQPVTLTWWHNATQDPLKGYFQSVADAYTAEHPNVTFKIEGIQNESIQTKITVALQSNDPPDIFQQWGGGDLATQVSAGKVQDITDASSSWISGIGGAAAGWQVDGKQYGVPYSLGLVGFWYRTDLFEKAGIDGPPATTDDLYSAVDKLKASGVAPIAVGSKDKWPDAFYWGYFATRECSKETLAAASKDMVFTDPCWLKAGQDTQAMLDKGPFQKGFLGTPAQQGAASSAGLLANGKAAMELQGQWNPGVITGLTPDKKSLGDKLAWFPFPAVTGGAGDPAASFGGGDGFSCSVDAPPACADFLGFLMNVDNQKKFGATNAGLPTMKGSEESVSDPTLKTLLEVRGASPYVQLYFDKALPTAVGAALNDEIANMFAGQSTPENIVKAVSEAAEEER